MDGHSRSILSTHVAAARQHPVCHWGLSAGQLLENERESCAPAAARPAEISAAPRVARIRRTPRLNRLAGMPRLARDATPDGGGTPCPESARLQRRRGHALPFSLANTLVFKLIYAHFIIMNSIILSCACEYIGIETSNSAAARPIRRTSSAGASLTLPVVAGRRRMAATLQLA